jgi:hypothetical protein
MTTRSSRPAGASHSRWCSVLSAVACLANVPVRPDYNLTGPATRTHTSVGFAMRLPKRSATPNSSPSVIDVDVATPDQFRSSSLISQAFNELVSVIWHLRNSATHYPAPT